MKRSNPSKKKVLIQVELDETIMDKNAFLSPKKKVFSLKEVLSLLPSNLTRDELLELNQKLSHELDERTSIICESIPDEIWNKVFQMRALEVDISEAFPLKEVCKRWKRNFPTAIDEVTIKKKESFNHIKSFKLIQSLTIEKGVTITDEIFQKSFLNLNHLALLNDEIESTVSPKLIRQMTNLTSLDLSKFTLSDKKINFINDNNLTSFVNLEYLKFGDIDGSPFESLKKLVNLKEIDTMIVRHSRGNLESIFGPNLRIINHLPNLKIFTLFRSRKNHFFNINEIQKRYPHVRFRWYIVADDKGYYEGSFSEDNKMSGKGKIFCRNEIYEGEFKNDKKEGKGVLYDNSDLSRYEGEYKNDKREGKGIHYLSDGDMYEGQFKNDDMEGRGVFTWSDGQRYEGQFKNDQFEGKGKQYRPNGDRFEGEFKNDECYIGIMYYHDGRRYAGEVSNNSREGKGIMFYPNGNRYEGKFKDDKRVKKGIFYYSNGEKVKGNESKFILNDDEGTIELLSDYESSSSPTSSSSSSSPSPSPSHSSSSSD